MRLERQLNAVPILGADMAAENRRQTLAFAFTAIALVFIFEMSMSTASVSLRISTWEAQYEN